MGSVETQLHTVLLPPSVLLLFNHSSNLKPKDRQYMAGNPIFVPKVSIETMHFQELGDTLKTPSAVNC